MRARTRWLSIGLAGLTAAGAAMCVRPALPPPPSAQPADAVAYGPLPETGRMLGLSLDEAEGDAAGSAETDPARLASLRMTRSAVALIEEGRVERALDLLERAIAIDGGTGYPYLYIGYIHLQEGRADRAAPFIERGAALMPPYGPLENELQALRLAARMEDAAVRRAP